tara:strand:- start:176 stop:430 length:255 start_codon:yes stop_codon:yes gene_type:complete
MLLRSGYNTDYKYGRETWVWADNGEPCLWKPKEFKSEVSRMRKRLAEMGMGQPCLRAEEIEAIENSEDFKKSLADLRERTKEGK